MSQAADYGRLRTLAGNLSDLGTYFPPPFCYRMPVYFFHLETQGGLVRDEKGEEFDLLQEAKGAALVIASELARNQEHIAGQHVLMTDAGGVVVFRTPVQSHEL